MLSLLLVGAFAAIAAARSTESGRTLNVDGIYYYVPASPVSVLLEETELLKTGCSPGEDLIPFTVMMDEFSVFNFTVLESVVARYTEQDDVFSGFLQGMLTSLRRTPNNDS